MKHAREYTIHRDVVHPKGKSTTVHVTYEWCDARLANGTPYGSHRSPFEVSPSFPPSSVHLLLTAAHSRLNSSLFTVTLCGSTLPWPLACRVTGCWSGTCCATCSRG